MANRKSFYGTANSSGLSGVLLVAIPEDRGEDLLIKRRVAGLPCRCCDTK